MERTTSVGGVIYRFRFNTPQVLLINHRDYDDWFLPKGHVEGSESLEETARREIKEEVGLEDLLIEDYLGSFTRVADENEEKTEHYFLIRLSGSLPHKIAIEDHQNWQTSWFGQGQLPKFYISGQEAIVKKAFGVIGQGKV